MLAADDQPLPQRNDGMPTAICFVGPNGSGKSSIVEMLRFRGAKPGDRHFSGRITIDKSTGDIIIPIVNPDEIAKALSRSNPSLQESERDLLAFEQAEQIKEFYATSGIDFAFETVGSHPSRIEFLENLKAKGYVVGILFVGTEDPEINIRRVEQRVLLGGHDVQKDKIVSRYERTMALLPRYYEVADFMVIYDNSIDQQAGGSSGPRLLLTKGPDGTVFSDDGKKSAWLRKWLSGNPPHNSHQENEDN